MSATLEQRIDFARANLDALSLALRSAAPGGPTRDYEQRVLDAVLALGRLLAERDRRNEKVICAVCRASTVHGATGVCGRCGAAFTPPLPGF